MGLLVDNRLCLHIIKRVCANNDYNGIDDLKRKKQHLMSGTRTMHVRFGFGDLAALTHSYYNLNAGHVFR